MKAQSHRSWYFLGSFVINIALLIFFYLETFELGCADTVFLKDKKVFQGKVLPRRGSQVLLRTPEGFMTLESSQIANIYYDEYPKDPDVDIVSLYRQRSIQIPYEDIQGRYELAMFCLDSGLHEEAAREFRALIPSHSHQIDELERLINNCEESAFQKLLAQASWWGRTAHQEYKALSLIQSLQTRFPDFAEKSILKKLLYEVQGEMERRLFREELKKERVSWVTTNFKVYALNLFQAQWVGQKCEELRSKICKVLGMNPDQNWETPSEVMVFKNPQEYFKASGAESWSGAVSFVVFDLDVDSLPNLIERMILILFKDSKETEIILAHEITHLLFRDLLGVSASLPTWISEGFATYIFSDKASHPSEPIPLESLTQFQEYPPFERAFYEQSSQLVQFLIEKGGMEQFLTLGYLLGTGMSLEAALSKVYQGDFKSIEEFVDHLKKNEKKMENNK